MDILNETRVENFVDKLRNFSTVKKKRHIRKITDDVGMLEPRIFDIILRELNPKSVLELSAISNACKQVCESKGVKWQGVKYNRILDTVSADSDCIITGDLNELRSVYILLRALYILPKGSSFAMLLSTNFMLGHTGRWNIIKNHPFNYCYLFNTSMRVYADSNKYGMSLGKCAWYVWEKGNTNPPVIKFLDCNELNQEYMYVDSDGIPLDKDKGYNYKNKVNIRRFTVDKF